MVKQRSKYRAPEIAGRERARYEECLRALYADRVAKLRAESRARRERARVEHASLLEDLQRIEARLKQ